MARSAQTLALQKQLLAAGFNPGPLDGVMGPLTRAALNAYNASKAQPAPAPAAPAAPAQPAPAPEPQPAPNTLTSDPAFMAFMRASGLGLETAANQVRQQTAALNAARDVARGDIDFSAEQQGRTTKGGYESRGILRSSNTQQALDRVERDRLARQTASDNNTASQIASLNQGLASKVAEQQNRAAELGLSTAQSQDFDAQTNELKRRYPEYYSGGGK